MSNTIGSLDLEKDFPRLFEVKKLVVGEYSKTLRSIDLNNSKNRKFELGICLQILKSIHKHFSSIEHLTENCHIESVGSVASSLWEKALTLQYLTLKPKSRVKKFVTHDSFRYTPWGIKEMVKDVIQNEIDSDKKKIKQIIELQYLQYSFLCSIKHGNPFTLIYLNRLSESENFFEPKSQIHKEDVDVIKWIYLVSITSFLDALKSFSGLFCNAKQTKHFSQVDGIITDKKLPKIELEIPLIIRPQKEDFSEEVWQFLNEANS
jgi:hypothetical protein